MAVRLPSVLASGNALFVVYLVLLWLSASASFQFKTVEILERGFPGDIAQWHVKGDINNTLVESDEVAIAPNSNKRARLGKAYELASTDHDIRYVTVKSRIVSEAHEVIESEKNLGNGIEQSLFYAWFSDENHDSILVNTLFDLAQVDGQFQTYNVLRAPRNASFVDVAMLLRQFQTRHVLVELEVVQVESTLMYKLSFWALALLPFAGLYMAIGKIHIKFSVSAMAPVIAVAVVLVAGVLIPGNAMNSLSRAFAQYLALPDTFVPKGFVVSIQDTLHFIGFLVLTLVVLAYRKKLRISAADCFVKIMLFAVFTEVIQRHSIDRSSSMVDILIDGTGVGIGALIWFGMYNLMSKSEAH